LSEQECSETVVAATAAASGRAVVVAGVGHDAGTASAMARAAAAAGAEAVMIHQIVHPYRSAAGWVAYHQAIAAAVPHLGIVPYLRDSQVTTAMLKQLLAACPNVVGIKYAIPDPLQFAAVVKEVGRQRLAWICGIAESWAPFFWVGGAQGFTSGLVNVNIGPSLDLLSCLQAGDYAGAMKVWAQLKPFEDLRGRYANGNNVSVIKEALAQLGLASRRVRPPISELAEPERAEVAAVLRTWELAAPLPA
jgi:4-hydroxy-tetrahydrodipicolinate synthase